MDEFFAEAKRLGCRMTATPTAKEDRELMELAAKAAGVDLIQWYVPRGAWLCETQDSTPRYFWNPLTDDGDALRLAVKLDLNVFHAAKCCYAMQSEDDGRYEQRVPHEGDRYAATRRAIVRAGAEITRMTPTPTAGRTE
jgi:hypothetical protein